MQGRVEDLEKVKDFYILPWILLIILLGKLSCFSRHLKKGNEKPSAIVFKTELQMLEKKNKGSEICSFTNSSAIKGLLISFICSL